ncbi:hypothetical protein [Ferruginibacter sp.]
MNRFQIFYDILIGLLKNIVDSRPSIVYYNGLNKDQQDSFVTLVDPLQDFLIELKRHRDAGEIFEDFDTLNDRIVAFYDEFPTFPNLRLNQLKKSIIICKRTASLINNRSINPANYSLIPIADKIKPFNYLFYSSTIRSSTMIFCLQQNSNQEILEFQNFIDEIPDKQAPILLYILSKLGGKAPLLNEQYILIHNSHKKDLKKIISLLKLSAVCDGKTIHTPFEITRNPQIIGRSSMHLSNSYPQFLDLINILSEYNYEKDILNKYLRLYHVIENFMYKIPIVGLMNATGGNMFSIRNFKNLYSRVDKNENAALEGFIKIVFPLVKSGTQTFKQSIQALWNSLSTRANFNAANIDTFLSKLTISYTNATASTNGNVQDFYCKLIYQIRNSIVHNKETEYHILHSTLNPVVPFLLEFFLFPSLEEICFKLIIDTNNEVKYTRPTLQLYEE